MNKKIASELAIGIILFFAITLGGFLWLGNKNENYSLEKNGNINQKRENLAQQKSESEKNLQELRNKDGEKVCDVNIVFQRYQNGKDHVIFNNEDIGVGKNPILDGDNIVFIREMGDKNFIIYNGKNLNEEPLNYYNVYISNGNIGFVNKKSRFIYNNKDLGPTFFTSKVDFLSGDNYAYDRPVDPVALENNYYDVTNIIYNGENLGEGQIIKVTKNGIAYIDRNNQVIYKEKVIGEGRDVSKLALSGDDIAYLNKKNELIYNNVNFGEIVRSDISLADNHIAYYKIVDGEAHVFYDHKDLGIGENAVISGDSIAFEKNININNKIEKHIIFNGKDLGVGFEPVLLKGNLAYKKQLNEKNYHIIFNGKDLGETNGYFSEYPKLSLAEDSSYCNNN